MFKGFPKRPVVFAVRSPEAPCTGCGSPLLLHHAGRWLLRCSLPSRHASKKSVHPVNWEKGPVPKAEECATLRGLPYPRYNRRPVRCPYRAKAGRYKDRMSDWTKPQPRCHPFSVPAGGRQNELPEAARRALAEAAERRKEADRAAARPREVNGRDGPDPARYGDWEKKGIAVDF